MSDCAKIREKASRIRLIALDMDGTGINSRKEFTPRTRSVVQSLIDSGYLVVPTTGRSYYGLVDGLLKLQNVKYVISADGAYVTCCETGEHIWKQLIPCAAAAGIAGKLLEDGNCVYFHRDDLLCSHVMACTSRELYRSVFWMPGWQDAKEIVTEGLNRILLKEGRDVAKLGLFFTRPDGFEVYGSLIAEEYPEVNCFHSDSNVLEITSCRTSKGRALQALAQSLGFSPGQVCAIGDNGNDISMLEYAGLGIAMGNAIQETKEKADLVIGTNDEEGAADFLEEYFFISH